MFQILRMDAQFGGQRETLPVLFNTIFPVPKTVTSPE